MKKIVEFDEKCQSCNGTGLYVGMAERDGIAVVCSTCKGTGKFHFKHEYEDFSGRERKDNIKRVLKTNPGIMVGTNKGGLSLDTFGGMDYNSWASNKPFPPKSEMRTFTCPAWWYQCEDYKKKPQWKECIGWGSFSSCSEFGCKDQCWEKWDKENS